MEFWDFFLFHVVLFDIIGIYKFLQFFRFIIK